MNLKCRLILEDYRKQREDFVKLGDVVHKMLAGIAKDLGLTVLAVEHRVKEERSLAGKLERKGDLYSNLEDITDILGCRIICFLSDEIDKIGSTGGSGHGPEVSREGVQRDILPIVEGCTVQTKYGMVKTDYILFIAAGAFHVSKIDDLIPELQGRFPIRVELDSLNKDDFYKILTQPYNAITKQYQELLAVDNVELKFEKEALMLLAELAANENDTNENLGARRLHSIMEHLLEDVLFNAGSKKSDEKEVIIVDKAFVEKNMKQLIKKIDLHKYVL